MKKVKNKKINSFKNLIKKREVIINLTSILLIVSLLIGTSYSAFIWSESSNKQQTLVAGTFALTLDDTSPTLGGIINISNAYPMSDENGVNQEVNIPYKFKIKNTGDMPITYTVKLVNDETVIANDVCSTNLLDDSNVKINISGDSSLTTTTLNSVVDNVILTGTLEANTEKSVALSLWIKDDAKNDIIGKHFHKKLVLDSSQILPLNYENSKSLLTSNGTGNPLLGYRIYGNSITNNGVTTSLGETSNSIDVVNNGKNLFDKDNAEYLAGYITITGNKMTGSVLTDTFYVPCLPNTTYTLSRTSVKKSGEVFRIGTTTNVPYIGMAVSNINGGLINDLSITTTTSSDAKYLVFCEGYTRNVDDLSKFQLEIGTTATAYEPYKKQTTTIDLTGHGPLRSVDNIRDYIEYPSNKLVKKIGVKDDGSLYILDEPVKEDISLPQIPTYKGTTNISIPNGGTITGRWY